MIYFFNFYHTKKFVKKISWTQISQQDYKKYFYGDFLIIKHFSLFMATDEYLNVTSFCFMPLPNDRGTTILLRFFRLIIKYTIFYLHSEKKGWLWKLISDNCCIKKCIFFTILGRPNIIKICPEKRIFDLSLFYCCYLHSCRFSRTMLAPFVNVLWFGKDFSSFAHIIITYYSGCKTISKCHLIARVENVFPFLDFCLSSSRKFLCDKYPPILIKILSIL